MPLTDKERTLCNVVVTVFASKSQPVSYELLLRAVKDPRPILGLSSRNVITTLSGTPPDATFVPSVVAFYYSGNEELTKRARTAVEGVIPDLKRAFEQNYRSTVLYTFQNFAAENASNLPVSEIALGLFLCREIPNTIINAHMESLSPKISTFQISDHILNVEPTTIWNEHIHSRVPAEDSPIQQIKEQAAPAPTPTPPAPQPKWRTLGSLGEGGQGWTFTVRRSDDPLKQTYVQKRLKNKARLQRFRSEIDALSKLQHPGILKIIDTGEDEKGPYFITEYCQGTDLSKANLSGLNLPARLTLFRQVCDAIACAHNAQILHRDLKPSNIFLRNNGSVAVGDFGLCIDLNDAEERATLTSEAIGARMYIAPELETGRATDPQANSDVYSLGKVLYYILSSRNLPREDYSENGYDLRKQSDPEMHFVYELFDKCIRKSPEERCSSALELLESLDGVIERVQLRAHVLNISVRQRCIFCGVGAYQFSPSSTNSLRGVCDRCGNVQTFVGNVGNLWWERKL